MVSMGVGRRGDWRKGRSMQLHRRAGESREGTKLIWGQFRFRALSQ